MHNHDILLNFLSQFPVLDELNIADGYFLDGETGTVDGPPIRVRALSLHYGGSSLSRRYTTAYGNRARVAHPLPRSLDQHHTLVDRLDANILRSLCIKLKTSFDVTFWGHLLRARSWPAVEEVRIDRCQFIDRNAGARRQPPRNAKI